MSKLKPILTYALLTLWVSACISQPDKHVLSQFKTLITPDGVKRFELPLPKPDFRVNLSENSRSNPYDNELSERKVMRRVEAVLETTGFCKTGFILLGRHAGETAQKVRGECKEAATQNERQQFKNSITQW